MNTKAWGGGRYAEIKIHPEFLICWPPLKGVTLMQFLCEVTVNILIACIAGSLCRVMAKRKGVGEILQWKHVSVLMSFLCKISPPFVAFSLSQSLLCQNPIWHPDRHFTGIYEDRQLHRLWTDYSPIMVISKRRGVKNLNSFFAG